MASSSTPPGLFRGPAYWAHRERNNLALFVFLIAVLVVGFRPPRSPDFGAELRAVIDAAVASPADEVSQASSEEAPTLDETSASQAAPELIGSDRAQVNALARFLSRRYLVAADATRDLVLAAYRAGRELKLDPLLIIAVMAVESRFNPIAESVAGAKGLMQVIPKYHPEKLASLGGEQSVLDPQTNILLGASILKEYIARTGSLGAALQLYNGSSGDGGSAYSEKVIAEKNRLHQLVRTLQGRS